MTQPKPEDVNLAGAVDLSNPILTTINGFRDTCVAQKVGAIILIARGADGNVFAASKSPGGIVEQAGMLSIGKILLQVGFTKYLHDQAGVKSGDTKQAE